MRNLKFLIAAIAIGLSFTTLGQNTQIKGIVRDAETQELLQDVVVEVNVPDSSSETIYTTTNSRGAFSAKVSDNTIELTFKIIGYQPLVKNITVNKEEAFEFFLTPQPIPLGELVVSSFRVNRSIRELPTPLAVVEAFDFQQESAITLSNVLANEPGVAVGGDGVWATNVNVRGLSENRLVTLIDGNRVETATDLTASFSMIDVNDVERVEVIKGAQSSLYGTGAMGGIINIITKDGSFKDSPYLSGNIITGFSSVNEKYTGHASINAGAEKWYLRASGSYTDASNINTPEGVLPNSQFTANNLSATLGVKPLSNHKLKINFQRYWANDVGIPGGDAFPGPATATYTDIGRQLISANYEITDVTDKLTSLKLNYFTQYILRDVALSPNVVNEVPIPTGTQRITPELFTPTGEHLTHGAQLQTSWQLSSKNTLTAGIDVWARKLTTSREKYIRVDVINEDDDIEATNNLVRGETPIPESTFGSAGVFVQDETNFFDDKLTLILGGRLDGILIQNEQGFDIDYLIVNGERNDTPPNQRITFEEGAENDVSWSANTGLLYNLVSDIDLSLNLARSFRSPSLEERFKYIDLGNLVRLGDPSLNPESGYSVDMGVRVWKPSLSLQVNTFANWLTNMIVETPGEFIYTINTGPSQGTTDTTAALINANVSKAFLYGADLGFQYNVYSGIVLFGSGAYVRGRDTEAGEDLPLIPPLNGRLGLRYKHPKMGAIQFAWLGATKQDKLGEGELQTDGYSRFDIALSSHKINVGLSSVQLFAGVDNVTNRKYTNHLSTNRGAISIEPGRNIYLRLRLSF